jgi:hypothetical protein
MFNEDLLTPVIPPTTYRLRLLKKLVGVIENDDEWDPEEDVCNLFVYCNPRKPEACRADPISL